ncbi:hypothetical protein QG37_04528 [Candidozyma auris]|uniref:Uncharacterized protein n=1 Tax=Candidozyma auris TaxID=498019 RepID=A0A0L0NY85_CANAR|nr:hypothetical protein QG37_04528 [[Candida] auris]
MSGPGLDPICGKLSGFVGDAVAEKEVSISALSPSGSICCRSKSTEPGGGLVWGEKKIKKWPKENDTYGFRG